MDEEAAAPQSQNFKERLYDKEPLRLLHRYLYPHSTISPRDLKGKVVRYRMHI